MNDETIREQLSSLMDGELSTDSARFLSKRLGNDAELASTWERWHCVRDSLRQQEALAPVDFCARVRDAIDAEAAPAAKVQPAQRVWQGLAGAAIAAGVAAFALLLGSPAIAPQATPGVGQATLAVVAPVTTSDLTPNWGLSPVAYGHSYVLAQPRLSSEFDNYFIEHGLANGSNGALGMVPYVPVVSVPATNAGIQLDQAAGQAR